MGIFIDKCIECKSKQDVKICPFCKKYVCSKCQSFIVFKSKTPEWFVGKKVQSFEEYKNLYLEYYRLIKEKGYDIHCCNDYLNDAWAEIVKKVQKFTKDTKLKSSYIVLK